MSPLPEGAVAGPLLYYRYRLAAPPGYEYVSPSVTAVVGYTPEEHYADPLLGFKLIHPDDAVVYATLLQSPEELVRPVVLRWRRRNGSIVWAETHNTPVFDASGRWVGIEGFAFDVTAREQAQARSAGKPGRSAYLFWRGVRGGEAGNLLTGHIEELADVTIVHIEGEIDLSTAALFRAYLSRAARVGRPVVVDLTRVEYFDASGLRAMDDYRSLCRQRGLELVVVPSPLVQRILTIGGPDLELTTAESLAAAIRRIVER